MGQFSLTAELRALERDSNPLRDDSPSSALPMSYPRMGAIDRTRTGSGFPRCSRMSQLPALEQRGTRNRSAARASRSLANPDTGAARRKRAYDGRRLLAQGRWQRICTSPPNPFGGVTRSTRFYDKKASLSRRFAGIRAAPLKARPASVESGRTLDSFGRCISVSAVPLRRNMRSGALTLARSCTLSHETAARHHAARRVTPAYRLRPS